VNYDLQTNDPMPGFLILTDLLNIHCVTSDGARCLFSGRPIYFVDDAMVSARSYRPDFRRDVEPWCITSLYSVTSS